MLDSLIQLDTEDDFLSFKLSDSFLLPYQSKEAPFGYRDVAGNSAGEIIFIDKYSRLKADGTKEHWWEACRRIIEGMYSIQKDWAKQHSLPWNSRKAHASAKEAYDLLFRMCWTPPGRGLSAMGSRVVHARGGNSMPLQNCAVVSTADMTKDDPANPFCFLFDVGMLGVGIGTDVRGAEKGFVIHEPSRREGVEIFVVPDSREGWVEALKKKIESYLIPDRQDIELDTSLIREKGAPIKTFGGVAPGPAPLELLMDRIDNLLGDRDGDLLTEVDIADLMNMIGVCIVSGNVRRMAELILGDYDSDDFLNLKNPFEFPERNDYSNPAAPGWGHMSNNTVRVTPGQDYSRVIDGIKMNGEPGLIWFDNIHNYGRIADGVNTDDRRTVGGNPCNEQFLESKECCTLADLHLSRIHDEQTYIRAIKYAFLYAKTVTLLPTHLPETNAIMQRNRRIGLSVSGVADFMDNNGRATLKSWLNEGYGWVQHYDTVYSEWLCVRESIRTTTLKPTGTTGLMVGESPGAHWTPGGKRFWRTARFPKESPIVQEYAAAGYRVEADVTAPDSTVVVYFPVETVSARSEREVSIFEKAALAVDLQKYWSDNGVSVTISFDPKTEADYVQKVLEMHDSNLKAVSFLPMLEDGAYAQMPYSPMTQAEYSLAGETHRKVDMDILYLNGKDAEGESGCVNDTCLT